jgi:hypothetical protein
MAHGLLTYFATGSALVGLKHRMAWLHFSSRTRTSSFASGLIATILLGSP